MRGAGLRRVLGAAVLAGSVALAGIAWSAAPTAVLDALRLGRPPSRVEAPPFDLTTLDGRPMRLADLRGRVVLLYFWATW